MEVEDKLTAGPGVAGQGLARLGVAGQGKARPGKALQGLLMSFVYIISDSEAGPVKIGRSNSPFTRKGGLQVGNPSTLYVFATIQCKDAEDVERRLHLRFVNRHIRGEWFSVSPKEAAKAATDYGYDSDNGDFDSVQTHRSSAFDVRPIRGGQQHATPSARKDVLGQPSAFDSSRRQPLLDAVRREH